MPSSVRSRILSAIFLFVASSSSPLCPIQRSVSQCSLRATASQGRSQEIPFLQEGDGASLPGPSNHRGLSPAVPNGFPHSSEGRRHPRAHTLSSSPSPSTASFYLLSHTPPYEAVSVTSAFTTPVTTRNVPSDNTLEHHTGFKMRSAAGDEHYL